jgi:AcrR family transcriptional regulator
MKKAAISLSTEEKIQAAARKIFTSKGYAATRTRDIAEEAGINLALLNYYFRSKKKLFELVMLENFGQFVTGIKTVVNDTSTTLEQKIDRLVNFYIDQLMVNRDLPLFVLNEIRSNAQLLTSKGMNKDILLKSHFMQQLTAELKRRKKTIHPLHVVMNTFSMTIFPFLASPIILELGVLKEQEFRKLMEERRRLVPAWLKNQLLAG